MTKERMILLLKTELECVNRQDTDSCNRDECGCQCCDLIQDKDEIVAMYEEVINIVQTEQIATSEIIIEHGGRTFKGYRDAVRGLIFGSYMSEETAKRFGWSWKDVEETES